MIHAEPKTATRATGGQDIGSMLSDAAMAVLQGKQAEIAGRISARESRLPAIPQILQGAYADSRAGIQANVKEMAEAIAGQARAKKSALRTDLEAKYAEAVAAGRPDDMLVYKERLIALL